MQEMWQKITDCWQLKAVVAGLTSCLTFLLGDFTAPSFIALWGLVGIDTLTRWMAIGRKYMTDNNLQGSIWSGVFMAFIEKKINSEAMRGQFQTKAMAYLILLIGFNLLDRVIPDAVMGQNIDGIPGIFISTWLAFVELQSIIENLVEMGMTGLTPLSQWICRRREKMTGDIGQVVVHKEAPK
jgi:hypothetical protein